MSNKIPVDLIARLHGEGKKPTVIVQTVWKQTGAKLSVADVRTITGALVAQSKELPPVGPLLDFIPAISPRFMRPRHLAPIAEQFEQIGKKALRLVAHAPPRHSKPLGKDTRVTMADGSLRPISELRVGDRVVSGEGRITSVCGFYRQGALPVVRVTTRSGRSFLAEGSHRFLTQRGWVRVDELKPYDRKAWQRPRGDYLLVGGQYETTPAELDPDLARFLGYMTGDGNTTQNNCRWTNIDQAVRAEFIRTVEHLGGVTVEHDRQTLGVNSGAGRPKRSPEEQRAWHANYEKQRHRNPQYREKRTMGGHHLRALLASHGLVGKTAHQKTVPAAVFTAQPAAVLAFLAAYFECDGCRGVEPGERSATASYSSVSRALLDGCQALLARFGIRTNLYQKRGLYKGAVHLSWGLSILDQARFFDLVPVIGDKAGPKTSSRRLQADLHLPDGVISVTPAGTEECFCITVKHDESFLAEGLVTHNTELVLHTIAHGLRKDPTGVYGYASYGQDLTFSKSTRCRELAQRAGVRLSREAAKEWRTTEGGGLLATSTGGPLTGHGITRCMFVDDAYKNRVEAESKRKRGVIWDWFSDVVMTRIEPGASVVIFMVRWNQDDLAGRALRELGKHKRGPNGEKPCKDSCPGCGPNPLDGFEEISLPAIDMNGAALWPEVWPIAALESKKRSVTEYTWLSQYQGTPRQRGSNLFEGVNFYDPSAKPRSGFSVSIGIDLSYTESTSADWAVAVVLMKWGTQCWVMEVLREQTTAPKFAKKLKALRKRWRGAPMYSIFYGPEKGSIDFMRQLGVPVKGLKRPGDKFVRSQAAAAAWNDGRVLVPGGDEVEQPEWLEPFIEVVTAFTGVKDDIDDDVDALVAAFEGSGMSAAEKKEEEDRDPAGRLIMPGDDIGFGGGGIFG